MKGLKKVLWAVGAFTVAATLVFTGCGKKADTAANKSKEPVQLIWYLRGSVPNNSQEVLKEANDIIKQKINAVVDFRFIESGSYNDRLQMIMASAEEYDIAFTSSWANNYAQNVKRGAYIPLDELLDKYPNLKQTLPQPMWDAVKIGGKIYAIPNYQVMYEEWGAYFRKDLVEKYNIDLSKINDIKDLTQIFQMVKSKEPGIYACGSGFPWVVSTPFSEIEPYLFAVDTNKWQVVDSTEYLKDNYKLMREWYKQGFFPEDVATGSSSNELMKNGKVFAGATRMKPGAEAELKNNYKSDFVIKSIRPPVLSRNSAMSTLSAISSTSKDPETAMKLLELMNTDKQLLNLLSFGIEGKDYTKVRDNKAQKIPGQYEFYPWMLGNQFNSYTLIDQPDDIWEETIKKNEQAAVDPLIQFEFDRTPVENELNQMNAIRTEFEKILFNGLEDTDKILAMREEKLNAAGKEKVRAEMQRQLDAWRSKQSK